MFFYVISFNIVVFFTYISNFGWYIIVFIDKFDITLIKSILLFKYVIFSTF